MACSGDKDAKEQLEKVLEQANYYALAWALKTRWWEQLAGWRRMVDGAKVWSSSSSQVARAFVRTLVQGMGTAHLHTTVLDGLVSLVSWAA
jgi:hypothetical protein